MKAKTTKRKIAETAVGAALGSVIAGPIGALAGALATGNVESGLDQLANLKPPVDWSKVEADDPVVHARLKRILVPLDFSVPSKRALRFARAWATLFGAEVCLLHVVEPATVFGELGIGPSSPRGNLAGRARAALNELARAEFPDSIRVTVVVRKGQAFDQIAAAARDIRSDVIIISTHGHTGLKHVLLGSTAERVARHAPCPVLILRRGPTSQR